MNKSGRFNRYFRYMTFIVSDYITAELAFVFALELTECVSLRGIEYDLDNPYIYIWVPLIFIFVGVANRLYHMRPVVDTVKKSFYCVGTGILCSLVLLYFKQNEAVISGWFPLFFILSTYTFRSISDYALRKFLKKYHLLYVRVAVIGAGLTAEKALRFYENDIGYRYDVVGIIDDNPKSSKLATQYRLLGDVAHAGEIIKELGVDTALIIAPGMKRDKLINIISDVQPYVRNLNFVPDLLGVPSYNIEPLVLFSEEMLVLKLRNQLSRRRNQAFKRAFDLVLSLIGLLPVLLILAVIAVAIKRDSKGPVFYNAERIGKGGKTFKCLKFRSMYTNGDEILKKYLAENPDAKKEWDEYQKLREFDPRVTKVGAFIRKTSLDELPQVLNVIKGEMSLVGPRPYLPREREMMGGYYDAITLAMPGITGLWQVSGRSEITFDERLHLESWYVHNWSVWMDLVLLFRTFNVVLHRKGAM